MNNKKNNYMDKENTIIQINRFKKWYEKNRVSKEMLGHQICKNCTTIFSHYRIKKFCDDCNTPNKRKTYKLRIDNNFKLTCVNCNEEFIYSRIKKYCNKCSEPKKRYKIKCISDNPFYKKREKVIKLPRIKLTLEQIKLNNQKSQKKSYIKRKLNGKHNELIRKIYSTTRMKVERNLRNRIWQSLKRNKTQKSNSFKELSGCDIPFLIKHLEKQFNKNMSWDNYGIFGWHIDHIIPCSKFDLTDIEQQKQCFHYSNLQPLWWDENIKKRDKILKYVNKN